MPSVGGISCDFVKGTASELKTRVTAWQEPGQDGFGVQSMGTGESDFRFTITKIGSLANVNTWIGQIEPLKGTLVTIVDDFADSRENMLIQAMGPPLRGPFVIPGGTTDTRCDIAIEGVKTN